MRVPHVLFWSVRPHSVVVVALVTAMALGLPAADAVAAGDPDGQRRLIDLVNRERSARGLDALRACADLSAVAGRWSARMAADGQLSHNPRLGRAVDGWDAVGEIVGHSTAVDTVHRNFMASRAHRASILSTAYTEVGVGVEHRDGRVWVTEVFRRPDGSVPCATVSRDAAIAAACPPDAVPPAAFVDILRNTHRAAIDCGAWYGLIHGTSRDHYSPSNELDRAQMATFLTRLVDRTSARLPPPRDQGFTDIAGDFHADAINQLARAGIVQGTSASTYAPSAVVTRAQMATFIVRAYEFASRETLPAGDDRFTDDGGGVHEPLINKAAQAGLVAGTSPTAYTPDQAVERDQLASFLVRALSRLVERGHATPER